MSFGRTGPSRLAPDQMVKAIAERSQGEEGLPFVEMLFPSNENFT
jgi:hypothetical protein